MGSFECRLRKCLQNRDKTDGNRNWSLPYTWKAVNSTRLLEIPLKSPVNWGFFFLSFFTGKLSFLDGKLTRIWTDKHMDNRRPRSRLRYRALLWGARSELRGAVSLGAWRWHFRTRLKAGRMSRDKKEKRFNRQSGKSGRTLCPDRAAGTPEWFCGRRHGCHSHAYFWVGWLYFQGHVLAFCVLQKSWEWFLFTYFDLRPLWQTRWLSS